MIFTYNKTKKLDTKNRNEIAGAIIKYILNKNPAQSLVRADFNKLSSLICELFTGEKPAVYYLVVDGRSRGKLYNSYCNYKTKLGASAAFQRKKHISKKEEVSTNLVEGIVTNLINLNALKLIHTFLYFFSNCTRFI